MIVEKTVSSLTVLLFVWAHLVIVKVVGQASYEQLMGRIRNDGGDDACGDDHKNICCMLRLGVAWRAVTRRLTWDMVRRLLRDAG